MNRVFARNQWLRYGGHGFWLFEIAARIRSRMLTHSQDRFITKLRSLGIEVAENVQFPSVILIAIDDDSALTIIEGNHRMTAAALASPDSVLKAGAWTRSDQVRDSGPGRTDTYTAEFKAVAAGQAKLDAKGVTSCEAMAKSGCPDQALSFTIVVGR